MFLQCRGCGQSVPGSMPNCQFCGASLAGASVSGAAQAIAAPRSAGSNRIYAAPNLETPKWVATLYYLFAGLYVFAGLVSIVTGFVTTRGGNLGLSITIGLVQIVLGVGLILRNDTIRGIVNFILWISVAVNSLILFFALMAALGAGGMFFVFVVVQALSVGLSLGIIWLNNEMD